jgi:glutamyl-tRNA synthetase
MEVRVRFAPSPTGYLHVGGLRTALYNYLFARHNNGKMILRIEDTDRTRFVEGATENLIKYLEWSGISFDEGPHIGGNYGPYIQSERFDLYKKYGMQLIENGQAYYAFDTSEELDFMRERQQKAGIAPKYDRTSMKNQFTLGEDKTKDLLAQNVPFVVRLKVPFEGEIKFKDMIRGEVTVRSRDVDDQILLKSDGFPTYHLANVVDDHLMGISHVIRGEEWLPSTPKHILLYQSFDWEAPDFAHLPLLLNKDKSKLSKRQGDVAVEDYVRKGYFKEAFVNFIALLGWNPTSDREIFSMQELIETFSLEKVNKSGAIFDITKLNWMNSQYLRTKSLNELADFIIPFLQNINFNFISKDYLMKVIDLIKERIDNLIELPEFAPYMFAKPKEYDQDFIKKHWKENTQNTIEKYFVELKNITKWDYQTLHDFTQKYCEENNLKLREIVHPLRIMITGKSVGAGLFETMSLLQQNDVLDRISYFLENIAVKLR